MKKKITVKDKMQNGYFYYLTKPIGKGFHPDFKPELTPKQMLELGVFGGFCSVDCFGVVALRRRQSRVHDGDGCFLRFSGNGCFVPFSVVFHCRSL